MAWADPIWAQRFDTASKAMAVATGFAIPMPTVWPSYTMGLFLLFWLLAGNFRDKGRAVLRNSVALWALALFALLALGVLYSAASTGDALSALNRYRKLYYIALLVTVLDDPRWTRRAYHAFLAAMAVVVALSYAKYWGWLPAGTPGQEYTVFKGRIAHSIFLAFALFALAHGFMQQTRRRWLCAAAIVVGLYNLVFMIGGRTGYLVFVALVVLFVFQLRGWRGAVAGVLIALSAAAVAYQASPLFQQRANQTVSDIRNYSDGDVMTAVGLRLSYYKDTLALIANRPIFGYGTGAFATVYARLAKSIDAEPTTNPHNEYLLITAQLGIVGLALFLWLGIHQWRVSYRLPPTERWLAQGLLVAMGIGCLFNSLLMDFSEGHFYAFMSAVLYASLSNAHRATDAPNSPVPAPSEARGSARTRPADRLSPEG